MLSTELLLNAAQTRRCLRTNRQLDEGEYLISRSAFPGIYTGQPSADEIEYALIISRQIPSALAEIPSAPDIKDEIRGFLAKLISATKSGREEFIHRYLFEFWDESWGDATERISLAEKYYHGKCDNAQTPFAQRLLPRLVSSEAVVDIIALGGPHNRTLFPIEIKLGYLDDRGHGQILRYYQHARSICDRFNRDCDIRHVSPVLILSSATLSQWDAVPQYFKEIIHILFYRTTPAGHITLLDGKKVLNSQARDRLFNH